MKGHTNEHEQPREARLRAASAHLYPGVPAEIWVQASTLADVVRSRRLQEGAGAAGTRPLDDDHFEFRHTGMAPNDPALRRRATDRLRLQGD